MFIKGINPCRSFSNRQGSSSGRKFMNKKPNKHKTKLNYEVLHCKSLVKIPKRKKNSNNKGLEQYTK